MKKMLVVSLMLACLAPLAVGQTPAACTGAAIPAYNNCYTTPVDSCMSMDRAVSYFVEAPAGTGELKWLADLLAEDAAILFGLKCDIADINGDDGTGNLPMPNGMLDAFELGVIEELISNPSAHSALGTWVAQVPTQMQFNYQQLWTSGMSTLVYTTLPSLWGLLTSMMVAEGIVVPPYAQCSTAINTVFPDLMKLLAEYGTIGDTATLAAINEVGGLLALCDIVAQGSCLVTDLHAELVAGFPTKLGPTGDADGDGLTNEQEYDNVIAAIGKGEPWGVDCYVTAALDPTKNGTADCSPPQCTPMMYPSMVTTSVGGTIDISGNASNCLQGTITWSWEHSTKGVLAGTGNRLVIQNVDMTYNGTITATANGDPLKLAAIATIPVTVYAAAPLAGGLGLGLLAGVCALGGALSIRRKR